MMKYLYEFIGTFFLVLTVGLTVGQAGLFAPLAIGAVLAVMVYAGGHVSGGHYNPAVSLSIFLQGLSTTKELIKYWIAQFLGAIVAALVTMALVGRGQPISFDLWPAIVGEFLFTFALCFVVLNCVLASKTAGNSFFGLAIGFTVMVGAYAVGSISGAAFNPAVALGIVMMKLNTWGSLWAYFVANLIAAYVAAGVYKKAHPRGV